MNIYFNGGMMCFPPLHWLAADYTKVAPLDESSTLTAWIPWEPGRARGIMTVSIPRLTLD